MDKTKSFFTRERKVQTTARFISDSERAGIILQHTTDGDGAEWSVEGSQLKNFGFCSYMSIERHPALVEGASAALAKYGTNFSISRAYLECSLYRSLEATLERCMERHVLVTPSTTYAHLAAIPVLIGDRDLVIVDQFAHASVHMALELVGDVPVERLRHSRMDLLEQRLRDAGQYERVWYFCDGIYSMLGDLAPFAELEGLLRRFPKLNLYVDDAHGMSWTGRYGRGPALTHLGWSERVVVAVSLSKAFGASGGALAFSSRETRDLVRRCGGPLIFSGPMPPAALGAALGAAELHLTKEFQEMQEELLARISLTRKLLDDARFNLATDEVTPVFMIHYDSSEIAQKVVQAMRARGFYTCISTFPAVPMNKPSIRFTISRHNSFEDIRAMVQSLIEVSAKVAPASFEEAHPTAFAQA